MQRTDATAPGSPPAAGAKLTPAMRQYARFKGEHPGCVLFFRMGDFYEMFNEDAVLAHQVLGITLTRRSEGVPMAGVPHHAVEGYIRRMIAAGHRIAVCDQIQDPKDAKGVVDRAVTRVLTPGTLVDETLLDDGSANVVAAVTLEDVGGEATVRIAAAELSTGAFTVVDAPAARLVDELVRLGPSEIIHPETDEDLATRLRAAADALGVIRTPRADWAFHVRDAADALRTHFGVRTLEGFGLGDHDPLIAAAGGLLRYLEETQAPDGAGQARLRHLQPPRRLDAAAHVVVDATSLRSLEIERTMRSGRTEGALRSVYGSCRTSMGRRLLRDWLCFPLRDRAAIEDRQGRVAALLESDVAEPVRDALGRVQDVARIVGRLSTGRVTPRDVVGLGTSLGEARALHDHLAAEPAFASTTAALAEGLDVLEPLAALIARTCVDEPPAHLREGGVIRDGVDAELDEARSLQTDAASWLAEYQGRLARESGIPSLKVGFNRVFGYYIEVTNVHVDKVPGEFVRKQTLKNAERYVTDELERFEEKVTTAESRAVEREKALFEDLLAELTEHVPALSSFAETVAALDVLQCFAEVARRLDHVRPAVVDEPVLAIEQGRHPVLDQPDAEVRFVPNDTRLGVLGDEGAQAGGATLALITGPNMAGKSTYIRQTALITLLAHVGAFVPAASATIGLVDRIFTRIGASDELHAGQSTFMVEMTETASILHHATERSLVILDEIGRGTSTLDGLSLAWAITERLAETGCRTLFATHYHELTGLADRDERVRNLHVAVREWGDRIVFMHQILVGRTDRSYGIHVAQLAGLPPAVVGRARAVLETLAVQTEPGPVPEPPPPTTRDGQLGLFARAAEHPVVDELRTLELEMMSPLEAFDRLRALRDAARGDAAG